MATSTVENYLKSILRLQRRSGSTAVGEVARELSLTPGTVTTMMRHLSGEGYVDYQPRRGLRLTPDGESAALRVVRRHRLIELFLVQVMAMDWTEVHEEAEQLEHVVSDRLIDRMDEMLGRPTRDPHGDPIPDAEGNIVAMEALPLAEVESGMYRVVRVSDQDPDLLGWLDEKGMTIGEEFELSHCNRAAGVLEIVREEAERLQMGMQVAERVFVESVSA
ncbi:MAG: metal-dependent transcriptional regulator [Verrucomicrobiales bacterium]|jgi:DtxR family Mn-dependent transcriptional regulator|nr:metal-dependent transcriptional regulator [Verrucomicrobiales bacterium]